MQIRLTIPIEPVAQMRVRTAIRGGHAMAYKAGKQVKAENILISNLLYERDRLGLTPLTGPLALCVRVFRSIPASWPKKKQIDAITGKIRPTSKPDLDNFLKHLKDCANGVLWIDDAQVVEYLPGTGKYYSSVGRWEIEVCQAMEEK